MILVSVKSGQEIIDSPLSVLPSRPLPRTFSPYYDEQEFVLPDDPAVRAALPLVTETLHAMDYPWPREFATDARLWETVTRGVCQRLADLAPGDLWNLPLATLRPELCSRITPGIVDGVLGRMRRELLFGAIRVRCGTAEAEELVAAQDAAVTWKVAPGSGGSIEPDTDGGQAAARLNYDFGGGGKSVRLTTTIRTTSSAAPLTRLQLSVRPDQSWNSLRVLVERDGILYRGESSTALADYAHWVVLTWQPPGPDDQGNQIRTWYTLTEVARGPLYVHGADQLKISVELRRASALGAWWAKLLRNYAVALRYFPFFRYLATSVVLAVLSVTGTLASCSLAGYSFARLQWPGRDLCFVLLLATLMVPSQVMLVPQFLIMRTLGWYNTLQPLWAPHFFGEAFYIFLFRQFFKGVPRELEDAARMDGCGPLRVYFHVMLPLARPILAVVAVLSFMESWNDFMGPLIYVGDQRLYPLSLGLYTFTVQAETAASMGMGMTMAGSLLMMMPVVVIFFIAQRYFQRSVLVGSIKG